LATNDWLKRGRMSSNTRRVEALLFAMPNVETPIRTPPRTARGAVNVVICGGAIMGLALGIRHVQGLFLLPMSIARGWPREVFGFAIAMQNLCWGLSQPFIGMLADRFGSAKVIASGTLVYLTGLVLMAQATTPLGLVVSGGLVIGIAQSCTTFGTIYGALSRIVPEDRRGWALGLAGSMGGVGMFLMVPLTQEMQRWFGWAVALMLLGVVIAACTPAARALDDSAGDSPSAVGTEANGQSMVAAIGEAFRHRGFWLLNLGFTACGFQVAFIAAHLPAYLLDRGLDARAGVAGLAIIALANVASMYLFGSWGGLYRRKYLLAGIYLARPAAIALFLLCPLTPISVYLFCAVIGFLWLGVVPLTNGIVSGVFGVRYITTLFGFVFFGHQVGSFLGIWLGARVYDTTHSYNMIWVATMVVGLVAAVLHLLIDDAPVERNSKLLPAT
jgi:MFS family permease